MAPGALCWGCSARKPGGMPGGWLAHTHRWSVAASFRRQKLRVGLPAQLCIPEQVSQRP